MQEKCQTSVILNLAMVLISKFHTTLSEVPLVRIMLPFLAGCFMGPLSRQSLIPINESIFGLFLCVMVYGFIPLSKNYSFRWFWGLLTGIFLLLLGSGLYQQKRPGITEKHFSKQPSKNDVLFGRIISQPVESGKGVRVEVEISGSLKHGKSEGKFMAWAYGFTLKYGDEILIQKSKIQENKKVPNPGSFDYPGFLKGKDIFHTASLYHGDLLLTGKNSGNFLIKEATKARDQMLSIFRKAGLDGREYAVLSALILGFDDEIDRDLMKAYSATGAMHILSVSGLHVGIIYMVFSAMLGFLDKNKGLRILKFIILISFLWIYAFITGLSPAVLRAAGMISILVAGNLLKRKTNLYNTLAGSAILLLLYDASLVFDMGFQLSYLALGGILAFEKHITPLFDLKGLMLSSWNLISVSIAAQLSTLPLCLLYFHQFPAYFLFSSLLAIPLSTLIIYEGILLLMISHFETLTIITSTLIKTHLWLLNQGIYYLHLMPMALTPGIEISWFQAASFLLFMICFYLWLTRRYKLTKMLAVFLWISFLLMMVVPDLSKKEERNLTIYNQKSSWLISIEGKNKITPVVKGLMSKEDSVLMEVAGRFSGKKINPANLANDFYRESNWFWVGNKVMGLLLNPEDAWGFCPKNPDLVFIGPDFPLSRKTCLAEINPEWVLLPGITDKKKSKSWRKICAKLKIKCWDTTRDGAFRISTGEIRKFKRIPHPYSFLGFHQ